MIDYDMLRAEIPARLIMNNIVDAHFILHAGVKMAGFVERPLFPDELRSYEAAVRVGQGLLKKVMPDLKSEDLNTIKGRDRLQFLAKLNATIQGDGIPDSKRKELQLNAILEAVCDQRISIDEAKKIQDLLNSVVESDDGMPHMVSMPISDHELKNRLIHFGMMN